MIITLLIIVGIILLYAFIFAILSFQKHGVSTWPLFWEDMKKFWTYGKL